MTNKTYKDYNVVVLFFDKKGTYIQTEKAPISNVYNMIEEWSRTSEGMCQIIDMRKALAHLKSLNNE